MVHDAGMIDLPLHLLDELDWTYGNTLTFTKKDNTVVITKNNE